MKISLLSCAALVVAMAAVTACAGARKAENTTSATGTKSKVVPINKFVVNDNADKLQRRDKNASALPSAVIYKTNGDYNNNVTMTLNQTHTAPLSFPGPGDVGPQSVPLLLADGWLLDRRGGIGQNTVFLNYTYNEYAALPQVPSPSTLMKSIIAGARVTEAYSLPITANEARTDTAAVNAMIREGLPDARPLIYSVVINR